MMFKLFHSHPKDKSPKPNRENIQLVFGLGNPGKEYSKTYHNVGQLYIDHTAVGPFEKYRNFEFSKENGLIFVKSRTFMNDSGIAVKGALKYFDLKPENLIVVHDDSDITLGEYKVTFDQGSAGHNGIASIITHLKTQKFFRLRIGVRQNQKGKAGKFILKPISEQGLFTLKEVFSRSKIF